MTLHTAGRCYGTRPSAFFPELDPTAALMLDLAACRAGLEAEKQAADKAAGNRGR